MKKRDTKECSTKECGTKKRGMKKSGMKKSSMKKSGMKKWRRDMALLLGVMSAAGILSGCAGGGKDGEYRVIVDNYAEIMLAQDQDSLAYDRALEAVGAYLEDSGEETLTEALKTVQDTMARMEEEAGSYVPFEPSGELLEALEDYEMDSEEYKINADMRSGSLYSYLSSLEFLEFYLESERDFPGITRDTLEFTWEFDMEEQENMRGYCYASVNYWFAGWDEEQVEYVEEKVLGQFQSFGAETKVWENDRDAVELRLNAYLDNIERAMKEWETYIGGSQESLYELEGLLEEEKEKGAGEGMSLP